ncbi:MAG: hypothetical protein JO353_10500 [Phycisphaerae bacterium]|nr:hypothetical protein [Phycisphaerae bacterium]
MTAAPSSEHLAQLAAARVAAKKLRRAGSVAVFDGWSTICLGSLGFILSLNSLPGLVLGAIMVFLGWRQLNTAKQMQQLSPEAPQKLAINQLLFCAAICLYAGWSLYSSLHSPSELDQAMKENPELKQMIGSMSGLESTITVTLYVGIIVGSILIMGSTAWYYHTRSKILDDYLAKTPTWILDLQRRGEL